MTVTFTKSAVVALHCGLDQTRRVAGGPFEPVLTERDGYVLAAGVSPKLSGLCVSEGGLRGCCSDMSLNSGTNQRAQFIVVHSTKSS